MELRRLRYFLRIAAEGSLGKASRVLGIAQPALGRQIQLLETELGVRLFQRMPRGMSLTEEGEYLKEALEGPLQQVNIALQNVQSYSTRIETALTLGFPPTLCAFIGPRLVTRLQKELPNLKLRIVEDHSAKLAADLARGLVDIALIAGVTPDDKVFHSEVLRERLMLVGAPDSELAGLEQVAFCDLHRFPLVLPGTHAGLPTRLEKMAAGADTKLTVILEIDSVELTKRTVMAGSGYAILEPLAFTAEAARGDLISRPIISPDLDQPVLYAVHPHWRVARSTYNEVERIIFDEWLLAVESREWEADWIFDLNRLSTPMARVRPPREVRFI